MIKEKNGIIWKRTKKFLKVGDSTHAYFKISN
jgi:hypothetical protein